MESKTSERLVGGGGGGAEEEEEEEVEEEEAIVDVRIEQLLWKAIEEEVPEEEREVVRRVIGDSLIAENEMLFNELQSLVEILKEFRKQTDTQVQRRNSSLLVSRAPSKDYVQRELQMLVQKLTTRADSRGESVDQSFDLKTPREKEILEYVKSSSKGLERSSTPRPTSSASSARCPSSRCSSRDGSLSSRSNSSLSNRNCIEVVKPSLNAFDIDRSVGYLRKVFEEEKEVLLEDIEYVKTCLDEEAKYEASIRTFQEPTVHELKELEHKLEKKWLDVEEEERAEKLLSSVNFEQAPESPLKKVPSIRQGKENKNSSNVPPLPTSSLHRSSPTPPPVPQSYKKRPTSAQRFRSMVIENRSEASK